MKKILYLLLIFSFGCSDSTDEIMEEASEDFNLRSNFSLIGHRGGVVGTNTENTLFTLNEAINRSYTMAEIDIRFTSDGIPIIHHDANLSDLYSNETKSISSMSYEDIQNIKTANNRMLPYSLEEFAAAATNKIGFLLDFKGNGYPNSFYKRCLDILNEYNISNIKVAWSSEAKMYFHNKETFKIGLNYATFSNTSFSEEDYFLIIGAYDFNSSLIQKALDLNVEIVVSVNKWNYSQRGITNSDIIKRDINKMIDIGVRGFLIDDVYESLFNFKN